MIPVSLIIKGLYSYQEEQKIEFDRLIDGQLFGIFGSVGSGKSSILEAISFALYGETERLNQRDNRNYNMMNLKSDELLIDFKFKDHNDDQFRFMVRGKRHGKDFNKVNTFERSAYKYVNDEWMPLENTSAESVLGLSYENFRRTIIIPQGRFQEFLQLGDKARTDMLKEIFNLNKYEFFYQTTNLERKNNEELQHLEGQLLHFDAVNKEGISLKEQQVLDLSEALNSHIKLVAEKDLLFQAQRSLKKLTDDREGIQSKLVTHLEDEDRIKELDKKVQDYEYCLLHFKDHLSRKGELERGMKTSEDQLVGLNQSFESHTNSLEQLNHELVDVQSEFLKQDEYKDIVADYKLIRSLSRLKADKGINDKRIAEGEKHVEKAQVAKQEAQKQLDALKLRLKDVKAKMPDLSMLASLQEWFQKKEHLESSNRTVEAKIKQLDMQAAAIVLLIAKQLEHKTLAQLKAGLYPDYHLVQVQELRAANRTKQDELQNEINHFHLQMKLGEFSNQLEKGEPCMLCGSTHHPLVLKVEDVESHLLLGQNELKATKELDAFLEGILQELAAFIHQEKMLRQQREEAYLQLNQGRELFSKHEEAFQWEDSPKDPALVQRSFQAAKELKKELTEIEVAIQEFEELVSKKTADHERFTTAVNEIRLLLGRKEAEFSTLMGQIKKLSFSDYEDLPEEQIDKSSDELLKSIQSVKARFEELNTQIKERNEQKLIVTERIASTKQNLVDYSKSLKTINEELDARLMQSPFSDFELVSAVLRDAFDVNLVKKQVHDYNQEIYLLKEQLKQVDSLLGDQSFDAIQFNELEVRLLQLIEEQKEINSQLIREQAHLTRLRNDFEKKGELEKQREKLQHRAANINTLKQLFKGSGFVSYISTVYLQNLCEVANKRFYKLTRQQLRLEVNERNDFQVRDYLNNGKVRNVKTLSGGQTFQASLSLALALAESVQQQNKSNQNFFFLDEGFGSLDKESLQIAFDTLKSLRKENRIVGIISHVEELQQEIDVFLNVANDPFTGTKITKSWE